MSKQMQGCGVRECSRFLMGCPHSGEHDNFLDCGKSGPNCPHTGCTLVGERPPEIQTFRQFIRNLSSAVPSTFLIRNVAETVLKHNRASVPEKEFFSPDKE